MHSAHTSLYYTKYRAAPVKSIQTIYFDWGGVIADDPGDDFLHNLLVKVGASSAEADDIFNSCKIDFMSGKLSEAEFWQRLQDDYGLSIHENISDDFMAWSGLRANDTLLALVDKAKANGLGVALLSNMIEPTYNVLAGSGHFKHFDHAVISCKVGSAKPEKQIYEIALHEMNAQPETSLFIDDKPRNLEPAAAMGFSTILATNPEQIIADLSAYL